MTNLMAPHINMTLGVLKMTIRGQVMAEIWESLLAVSWGPVLEVRGGGADGPVLEVRGGGQTTDWVCGGGGLSLGAFSHGNQGI